MELYWTSYHILIKDRTLLKLEKQWRIIKQVYVDMINSNDTTKQRFYIWVSGGNLLKDKTK